MQDALCKLLKNIDPNVIESALNEVSHLSASAELSLIAIQLPEEAQRLLQSTFDAIDTQPMDIDVCSLACDAALPPSTPCITAPDSSATVYEESPKKAETKAPDSSATVYEESPKKAETKESGQSVLSSSPPGPDARRFRSLFDALHGTPATKEEQARSELPFPKRELLSAQEYWESRVLVPETQYPYESSPPATKSHQQTTLDQKVTETVADEAWPVSASAIAPAPVATIPAMPNLVASTSIIRAPIASTSKRAAETAKKPPVGTQKSTRLAPTGWIQAGKPFTTKKPASTSKQHISSSKKTTHSVSQNFFTVNKEESETPLLRRALRVNTAIPASTVKPFSSDEALDEASQDPFAPSQTSSARFQKRSSSARIISRHDGDTSVHIPSKPLPPTHTTLLDRSPPKTRISKYLPSFPGMDKPPSPPTNYAAIYAELAEEDQAQRIKPKARTLDQDKGKESEKKRTRVDEDGSRKKVKVEEQEDKGPPSEEFEGQNFVREIRRKRRKEMEADPLKYKGRGAYARGMPM